MASSKEYLEFILEQLSEPEDVSYKGVCFDRTLDLGCGYALTSLFIAN